MHLWKFFANFVKKWWKHWNYQLIYMIKTPRLLFVWQMFNQQSICRNLYRIFITAFFFSVPFGSHQEEGFGANQAQVHRHQLQDGSRSVPDPQGQDGLHGTPQEGRRQDHRVGCLNIFPIYGCISFHLTCNFRKYIMIFVNLFVSKFKKT